MYYYIGLEARMRDNKYKDLDAAIAAAAYAARKIGMPLRIFKMNLNMKGELVKIVKPNGDVLDKENRPEDKFE